MKRLTSGTEGPSRTFTRIGNPLYWAPEYMLPSGYGFEADLWALGICAFMMATGYFPYGEELDDPYKLGQKILHDDFKYPEGFEDNPDNEEMIDFINQMLNKNPNLRFDGSYDVLKTHEWFTGMNFVKKRF